MWVWGNAQEREGGTIGVARAAVEGRVRQDLLKEAIKTLLASGQADRVGVWVEIGDHGVADSGQHSSFRGIVAEKDGEATPAEWSRLSPQPPLPAKLLVGLRTVEQDVDGSPDKPMIGALIEMRRALWVPLQVHAQLRGILFAGCRKKQARLRRALLESVAAELALVMELEDERRLARERHEDSRRVLAALAGSESPSDILADIVKDCTHKGDQQDEPSAVFAAIGCLVGSPRTRKSSIHPPPPSMRFAWQSGAAAWIRALESEELSGVWRRALESHHVAGSEPGIASPYGQVARVVAWPLEAAGETLGALVAGVRRSTASLAALERLELSAALAVPALLRMKRSEEAADLEFRHKEVLAALEKQPDRSGQRDAEDGVTEVLNVIEWLEEGVVLFGANHEIRAVNSRFGQIIGLTPEELARIKTLDDLVASLSVRAVDPGLFAESWYHLA
jgi:PAS domain-containing protein